MIDTIFLDVDGVIADFRKQCENHSCIKGNVVDWEVIKSIGSKFWEDIEWTSEGKGFFNWLKKICAQEDIELFILTAVHDQEAKIGRLNWLKKNVGLDKHHLIIVNTGKEKTYYAQANTLLIDDFGKNCDQFIAAGGQAIKFMAMDQAKNAIKDLLVI